MTDLRFSKIKEQMLELLFPRVCPVCGRILAGMARRDLRPENPYICPACFHSLHFPEGSRCMCCSRPLPDETGEYCDDCMHMRRSFDTGVALLMHDDSAKKILYDLKYSNKRDNADMLACEAAGRYADWIRLRGPDVLVPVPLHRKRELQRGFNQAQLLARKLSHYLKEQGVLLPVDPTLLVRDLPTSPQKELSRSQRAANLQGAFRIDPACRAVRNGRVSYRRVLLIDDIYTSGATLSACAAVLKCAGVKEVFFLTFSIG